MLTIMIHAKIKHEMLNEYLDLVKMLVKKTTRKGCRTYSFNQNKDEPTEFVLYEQWENQAALDNHIDELFDILGPAKSGYPIPEKLMNMYESVRPVYYDAKEMILSGSFQETLKGRTGVIYFKDYWQRGKESFTNRSGDYIDLWNENEITSSSMLYRSIVELFGFVSDLNKSKDIWFWEVK